MGPGHADGRWLVEAVAPPRHGAPADGALPNWDMFPRWPPDLFAVTASLVDHCGCYSHPRYAGGGWGASYHDEGYLESILGVARGWMDLAESDPADPDVAEDPQPDPTGPKTAFDEFRRRWTPRSASDGTH